MNLDRQIGSLFIIGFAGTVIESGSELVHDLKQYGPAGVILFNRCLHRPELPGNIASPTQLRRLTADLQSCSDNPLLICIDQEGGAVRRLTPAGGFVDMPGARDLAATTGNTTLTAGVAEQAAVLLADLGINVNLAPVVDLDCNPDNPVIGRLGRSFSADPQVVAAHATAWIEAHRRHGVLSCLKHFPGHGSSAADSHHGFVDITDHWQELELRPYQMLLQDSQVDLIMTGHLFNRNIDPVFPATLSPATIDGLLRKRFGYDGAVISDDMQMRAITDRYPFDEAICRAVAAGVDLLIFGNNLDYRPGLLGAAVKAVRTGMLLGIVSEERLAVAVRRVQRLKNLVNRTQ